MSIDMTPFKALYGYEASTFVDLVFSDIRAPKSLECAKENQDILRTLKKNIQITQEQ